MLKNSSSALVSIAAMVLSFLTPHPCRADGFDPRAAAGRDGAYSQEQFDQYFLDWFERSERAKAEQPHWITPLATITPRLEQEVRFDEGWQAQPHGLAQNISGGARLELIPSSNVEVILGAPSYVARSHYNAKGRSHGLDDWGDPSLLVKYRLLSANEEKGNYIVTLFMAASAPTASRRIGAGHALFTPTIAFGKGVGDFDMQSTVGITLPNGGLDRLGMPLAYNTAFQYRLWQKFWPEVEFNYTYFPDGTRTGQSQLFVTPGLVIGRMPLYKTLGLTLGSGVQLALTRHRSFDRNWIFSIRFPF